MLRILPSRSEIRAARSELKRRGLSFMPSFSERLFMRWGHSNGLHMGDPIKSWDVLMTAKFLDEHLPKDSPIVDIGAYCSEIVPILDRMGFSSLTGIDLNPRVKEMPGSARVHYEVGDFLRTTFPDARFTAITAISVIEHGFNMKGLLKEMSRLLRPGGLFIFSCDYWPEKIDTSGIKMFDMDWRIFSEKEMRDFLGQSRTYGFVPHGAVDYSPGNRTIDCMGKQYTFAWGALEKKINSPDMGA